MNEETKKATDLISKSIHEMTIVLLENRKIINELIESNRIVQEEINRLNEFTGLNQIN